MFSGDHLPMENWRTLESYQSSLSGLSNMASEFASRYSQGMGPDSGHAFGGPYPAYDSGDFPTAFNHSRSPLVGQSPPVPPKTQSPPQSASYPTAGGFALQRLQNDPETGGLRWTAAAPLAWNNNSAGNNGDNMNNSTGALTTSQLSPSSSSLSSSSPMFKTSNKSSGSSGLPGASQKGKAAALQEDKVFLNFIWSKFCRKF